MLLQEGAAPVVISSDEDRSRSRDRFVAFLKYKKTAGTFFRFGRMKREEKRGSSSEEEGRRRSRSRSKYRREDRSRSKDRKERKKKSKRKRSRSRSIS